MYYRPLYFRKVDFDFLFIIETTEIIKNFQEFITNNEVMLCDFIFFSASSNAYELVNLCTVYVHLLRKTYYLKLSVLC